MVKKTINRKKNSIILALDTIKGRIATAIAAAFAFVIALSWNDAIKTGVNQIVKSAGFEGSTFLHLSLTAVIVTIVCIFGIFMISKIGLKK